METPPLASSCEPLLPPLEEVPIAVVVVDEVEPATAKSKESQVMDRDVESQRLPPAPTEDLADMPVFAWRGESSSSMDSDIVPVGRFRDGFCDCCAYGCCHGHCLTACCCPVCEWVGLGPIGTTC
jgi:hypothetical protein